MANNFNVGTENEGFAKKFSGELDKIYEQKAVTGFLADNAFRAKFVGAKTVMIPDVEFQGLADYDRNTGFSRGAITVANSPYTMEMDRGRSIQIDREDMDETGIANLAGQVMGEYVRTKVVPECDAYVLSKLAGVANSKSQTVAWAEGTPYAVFSELVTAVRDKVGYDEELVCFIDSAAYAAITNSGELQRMINVGDFKQGEINKKVKSIDGIALIPVTSNRMKTAYTFNNDEEGGFSAEDSAKNIHMLIMPKRGAHLIKKTEKIRVFTPEQNLDADAYKFDYRIYYDVFVKKSGLDAIWASFSA